ncbi:hypothetical protein ACP4OV_016680 [Aristida adscensionis]
MAFWGVEVKPGEPYVHEPSHGGRLRITQATLGKYEDIGWGTLVCNVGEKRPVRICALNPVSARACHLDLQYDEKEDFVLHVIGNISIHLSGYYIDSLNAGNGHYCDKPTGKVTNHTPLKRRYQGGDSNGNKEGCSQGKAIVCDNGHDNDNGHHDIPINSSKRETAKKIKRRTPSTEQVSNDKIDGTNQVMNEQRDYRTMHSSVIHVASSQAHEFTLEAMAVQSTGQEGREIMISVEGASNPRGIEKQNEEAGTCERAYSREDPKVARADVKMASDRNKINVQGGSLNNPIDIEDEDESGHDHLPILAAFNKRTAAKEKKCDTPTTKLVINDQKNSIELVNLERDTITMGSSAVHHTPTQGIPSFRRTQAHEIKREGTTARNVCQKGNGSETEGQSDGSIGQNDSKMMMTSDEGSLGSASVQGVDKQNEHAGEVPIHRKVLKNGLVIDDLKFGGPDAEVATNGKKVCVEFVGSLENGKIFDSSKAFKFKLGSGSVILGWDLGISGMRLGGKRRLKIPPALGYGDEIQDRIPPNSWLIYDVELIKVRRSKRASD